VRPKLASPGPAAGHRCGQERPERRPPGRSPHYVSLPSPGPRPQPRGGDEALGPVPPRS